MNQAEAKERGIMEGKSAAAYCEVGDSDRQEADCECEAPNVCKDCLTQAAYSSQEKARQYSPWEFFAKECNDAGDRSEGLWTAYEAGVAIGIQHAVCTRLRQLELAELAERRL